MYSIHIKKANMYSFIGKRLTKKQIEDVFLDNPQDSPSLAKHKAAMYMVIAFIYDFHTGAQIQTLEAAGKVFNISQQWAGTLRDRALKTLHNVYMRGYSVPGKTLDYT